MKHFLVRFTSYLNYFFAFFLMHLPIRIYLYFYIKNQYPEISFSAIFPGLIYDLIFTLGLYCLFGSILATLFYARKKFSLVLLFSFLYLLFFLEFGLTQYATLMNQGLDESILNFSANELWLIIDLKNRFTPEIIGGLIGSFILFYLLINVLQRPSNYLKKNTPKLLFTLSLVCFFLLFILINSTETDPKQGLISNKTHFVLARSIKSYAQSKSSQLVQVDDFKKINSLFCPHKPLIKKYPLFHKIVEKSSLSDYFQKTDSLPNIVYIIVESLSSDLIGEYANETGHLMPFLDSLSAKSLYFPNVVPAAKRTQNVLPASLCSVPNAPSGSTFQQLIYPNHLSLTALLSKSHFTSFYCGVRMEYLNMQGFMQHNKTNFLSEIWSKENRNDSLKIGASWGFPDHCLYRQFFTDFEKKTKKKPFFDIFLTISTHDPFRYPNLKRYTKKAKQKITFVRSAKLRKAMEFNSEAMGAYMYADASIKRFFYQLKKENKLKNTLFIITGDHGTERIPNNPMFPFKVPLLIYSDLLSPFQNQKTTQFKGVSSHLDLPVSIYSLLKSNFGAKLSDTSVFLGKELDTRAGMHWDRAIIWQSGNWKNENLIIGKEALIDGVMYTLNDKLIASKSKNQRRKTGFKRQLAFMELFSKYTILQNNIGPYEFIKKWKKAVKWKKNETKVLRAMSLESPFVKLPTLQMNQNWSSFLIEIDAEIFIRKNNDFDSLPQFGFTATPHKKMRQNLFLFKRITSQLKTKKKLNTWNHFSYSFQFSPCKNKKLKNRKQLFLYFQKVVGSSVKIRNVKISSQYSL